MPLDMLSLLLISVPVGLLGSLTGLGGASILVPVMVLFGVPVKAAIASGMVSIIATSSGSAAVYVKEEIANVKVAMYLEMFTSVGAIAGATITTLIAPVFLYFFFALFLMTSFLRFKRSKGEGGDSTRAIAVADAPPGQADAPPAPASAPSGLIRRLDLRGSYYDAARRERVRYVATHPLLGGLGMGLAGLAAGMLGIGAGAFKVTVQENILKLPSKMASATSNFIVGMTALAGTSVYLKSGLLNLTLAAPMAIGTTLGAIAGGRVLNRLPDRLLRALFIAVVVILIAQMLYKGVTSL
jgi:hypothetical protein